MRPATLGALLATILALQAPAGCPAPGQASGGAGGSGNAEQSAARSSSAAEDTTPLAAVVTLRADAPGPPVNRLLLGNNVQWIDNADDLLRPGSTEFDPRMLDYIKQMAPTVLRYPGGSNSDLYHWSAGMGAMSARGQGEHFHTKSKQKVLFGTAEFLHLCDQLGAEALVTVNVPTGTAQEAAQWVTAVNRGPSAPAERPRVRFWEVGNEPYLHERPDVQLTPEEFARRADEFARAMRQADPRVQLGLPIRSDKLGGVPAVHVQGFAEKALAASREDFDFIALHDTYLPFIYDPKQKYEPRDMFRAAMAATRVVDEDLAYTHRLLERYRPGKHVKLAITEYNALYSIGGRYDALIATQAGAMYVADLLRLLSERDDIVLATYWSAVGNWNFGAVSNRGEIRPTFRVLTAFGEVLRGRRVGASVDGPTFANTRVGAVPALQGTPTIAVLATTEGDRLRVVIINKDWARPARITLAGITRPVAQVSLRELAGEPYATNVRPAPDWVARPAPPTSTPLALRVSPHAIGIVEVRYAK